MAVGDVMRLSVIGDWGAGNLAVWTLHFQARKVASDILDVCADLRGQINTHFPTMQSNTFYNRQINVYPENVTPPTTIEYTTGFPIQGAITTGAVGQQLAAVVTLKTSFAGRSYRGRVYLPGLGESQGEQVGPISGTVSYIQAIFDELVDTYGAGVADPDWRLVVWSKKLGQANAVTSAVARSVWGVQRRRRAGTGA